MADLTITAANVLKGVGAKVTHGEAGASITQGQQVYHDGATRTWKLADADGASAAIRTATGTALNAASSGQPIAVQTEGQVNLGATLTPGVAYYLSNTPGGVCPIADVGTGEFVCLVGVAMSASLLSLNYLYTGVSN